MIKRALSFIIVFTLLLCVFSGCKSGGADSPAEAVEQFASKLTALDYKGAFFYVADYDGFGFDKDTNLIIDCVARSLKITDIKEEKGRTSARVTAEITTIDLRALYTSAAKVILPTFYDTALGSGTISKDELRQKMIDEIVFQAGSPGAPTIVTEVTVNIYNQNEKWLIKMTPEFYTVVTGYLDEANNLVTAGGIMGITTTTVTTESTEPPPAWLSDADANMIGEDG